jgi:hypothetical protein
MSVHVIRNSVPTPEEMGEILGLSSDHVAAVRSIMSAPSRAKSSGRASNAIGTARKRSTRVRAANKAAKKIAYKAAKK